MSHVLLVCLLLTPWSAQATLTLASDTDTATAGYFQLRWQTDTPVEQFILQEAVDSDFSSKRSVYQGSDRARVMSGKSDNTYYYRVQNSSSPDQLSNIVQVTVTHHPLSTAFSFFTIGAIVFIAILITIQRGNRQD